MKCVLTVAGQGTRLLPLTKELPKEMLPIYVTSKNQNLILKPILQVIFESLYSYKIRDFCFIVGKTKRAVEDHFTPDFDLVKQLKEEKKRNLANELDDYFKKLDKSNIIFTHQPKPIGFGNAIEHGKKFVGNDYFLLHAGDDIVISKDNDHLKRLETNFKKYDAEIACLIEEVENPTRYGVVNGSILEKGVIDIKEMQEKPKKPRSRHAIIAIYMFKPTIFQYLENARKKTDPDKQLAETFNIAIRKRRKVIGIILKKMNEELTLEHLNLMSKFWNHLKDSEKQGEKNKEVKKMKKAKISVIGLGFVGLSLAVINAKEGFETIGIDSEKGKLKNFRRGKIDFYEPNLSNYLKESLKRNKISFTENLGDVLKTDITFITVGTPSKKDGEIDLTSLKKVISDLYNVLKNKRTKHLIVIKSTVVPTTTSQVVLPMLKNLKNIGIFVNPEFLREGNALNDLIKPHLIVIGCDNEKDYKTLEKYYKQFYKIMPKILKTDHTTAEMIKYANNAFLATKISFINAIANICQKLPLVDVNTIAYAIGKDPRIGSQFLHAGPGFGGSCLPKDLSALIKFTDKFGNLNFFFKAVENVNQLQPNQVIQMLKSMKLLNSKKIIAILGLAFKKNTDDLREAVSVKLVQNLLKKRMQVRVHDPMAMVNFKKIFNDKISYCKTIEDCLKGANCCVILTEWDAYKKLKTNVFRKNMKELNIIDARRILDPTKFSEFNFKAIGFGPRKYY